MRRALTSCIALLAATSFAAPPFGQGKQGGAAIDKAFDTFWKADDPSEAVRAGERLVKAGVDFDTAWTRLKAGRPYEKQQTGEISVRYPGPMAVPFDNVIEVPQVDDPARSWPVRVQLHGGVNRPARIGGSAGAGLEDESAGARGAGWGPPNLGRRRAPNRIAGEPQIYIYPSGWADASWWHTTQVENILRLLDRVKRRYNVDESRVYLTGISDGGTGAYYIAMREATPWSAILPLNGSIKVLGNPAVRADGELYPNNLVNKPLYIVNGGRDPLYPVEHIQTHIDALKQLGVPLTFKPQPNAGHDTSWWAWERGPYEQFVRDHPRQPHPERVSWETERTDRHNRLHWLVIDRLGSGAGDATFTDVEIFPRKKPAGRADVRRQGNTIDVRSRGVREFTLLLSPDVFDFSRPIIVSVNGRPAFQGVVPRDVGTLLTWAGRDNDRTMLYGAELKIRVP